MIRNIIFDMDGVLVDSELPIRIATAKVLGLEVSPKDPLFDPFVGTGEPAFVRGVAESQGILYREELVEEVYRMYNRIAKEELKVFPGVREMLPALKERGYTVSVASAAERVKVCMNLECMGFSEDFFATVVTGNDVKRVKPAPDCYKAAAEKIGADPKTCVVVEDAVNGLRAARSAGMSCVGVASTFTREVLGSEGGADYTLANTADLLELLDFIQSVAAG